MKTTLVLSVAAMVAGLAGSLGAAEISLETAPPVVVKTVPTAGVSDVDPALAEIQVTYSKAMQDGSWSWSTWGDENFPELAGKPRYLADGRTCVVPVKLKPGKFYATWLNSDKFKNFKDANGRPAVPYLLTFRTSGAAEATAAHKAVRLVVGKDAMTLEGTPTTRTDLEQALQKVPDRANTVLEIAAATTDGLSAKEFLEIQGLASQLVQRLGLKHVSLVGTHPLGSKSADRASAAAQPAAPAEEWQAALNDDQRAIVVWTDRQFRSFFDARTFDGWSEKDRSDLEARSIDSVKGPRTREYYQAINTLAALRTAKGLPTLRELAFDRRDKDNRDRWMAIRALGILDDKSAVPELIHLVYHGNINTRWWAQISLVRLTGKNFARDWNAWGKWWNDQNGQPPYKPEIIRWWNGQPEPDKLAESLDEGDRNFLGKLRGQSPGAAAPPSSSEVAAKLRKATPLMDGIRDSWSAAVTAIQQQNAKNALESLKTLVPRIEEFRTTMKGTQLEAGTASALEKLAPLMTALEKGDFTTAQSAMEAIMSLGQQMEAQVKAIADAAPSAAGPEPVEGLANALVLHHDNGEKAGQQSLATSGHAVKFSRLEDTGHEVGYKVKRIRSERHVEAAQIYASRYGAAEPPAENFHLYLLNDQQQVLADVPFAYSLIERGEMKWYTLRTPSIEVPENFLVALNFNPHQTKGVYLGYSATNGVACHSLAGLPGDGFEPWKPVEWMVRVSLTAEPTKAKGFQSLADWKPPVAKDPFAGCRFVALGGDNPTGKQSYGGRGPAIRFKPADFVQGEGPLTLKGLKIFASRYGSGYPPDETKLKVHVLDSQGAPIAETTFAYGKFTYRAKWVDLVFDTPVPIAKPVEAVTVALDPESTQNKGIYFHYESNPTTSHSLVGKVADGFKELPDREWALRAAF